MIGWGVAAPHIGEIVDWRSFFSGVLLGKRTVDPEPTSTTYYTSIDAVSAKDVPLGGLIDTSHSPKTPHFGDSNGDFQHKRLRAYLGKENTNHDA